MGSGGLARAVSHSKQVYHGGQGIIYYFKLTDALLCVLKEAYSPSPLLLGDPGDSPLPMTPLSGPGQLKGTS